MSVYETLRLQHLHISIREIEEAHAKRVALGKPVSKRGLANLAELRAERDRLMSPADPDGPIAGVLPHAPGESMAARAMLESSSRRDRERTVLEAAPYRRRSTLLPALAVAMLAPMMDVPGPRRRG